MWRNRSRIAVKSLLGQSTRNVWKTGQGGIPQHLCTGATHPSAMSTSPFYKVILPVPDSATHTRIHTVFTSMYTHVHMSICIHILRVAVCVYVEVFTSVYPTPSGLFWRKEIWKECISRATNVHTAAAAAAKSLQSCPTLCDPIDISPPGSAVPGILQATTLEWVAISFSNAWKWKEKVKSLSRVWLFTTPWTAAHQAPPSIGFSRQEYWSGVPLPSPKCPYTDLLIPWEFITRK